MEDGAHLSRAPVSRVSVSPVLLFYSSGSPVTGAPSSPAQTVQIVQIQTAASQTARRQRAEPETIEEAGVRIEEPRLPGAGGLARRNKGMERCWLG